VKGISALALPILPQGRDAIASIAINMTSARLEPDRLTELVALLKAEVSDIEHMINPLERSGSGARRAE
jgi:DNA-binding IclR family transcriptional regulator